MQLEIASQVDVHAQNVALSFVLHTTSRMFGVTPLFQSHFIIKRTTSTVVIS